MTAANAALPCPWPRTFAMVQTLLMRTSPPAGAFGDGALSRIAAIAVETTRCPASTITMHTRGSFTCAANQSAAEARQPAQSTPAVRIARNISALSSTSTGTSDTEARRTTRPAAPSCLAMGIILTHPAKCGSKLRRTIPCGTTTRPSAFPPESFEQRYAGGTDRHLPIAPDASGGPADTPGSSCHNRTRSRAPSASTGDARLVPQPDRWPVHPVR